MTIRERISGPNLTRAQAGVEILDADKRTFRMSFSSAEPVLRAGFWSDPWLEVLGHNAEEVDMSRIDGGAAPLLWGHDSYSRDSHIGIVERAWLENDKGYADVRLSPRADLETLWADIEAGIVRNVSVGYQIHERTLVRTSSDGPSEYRVTRWTPMELSLVSVPADPSVGVGRQQDGGPAYIVTPLEERNMETVTPQAPTPAPADDANTRAAAAKSERERIHAINLACRSLGVPDELATQLIDNGTPIDQARAQIIEAASKRPAASVGNGTIQAGADEAEKRRDAAVAWLCHRSATGVQVKPEELNGNVYRGMSLLEMAKDSLQRRGINTVGMGRLEVAGMALQRTATIAHSTSDFDVILQNVMNKVLLNAYTAIPDTWRSFCAVGNLADFRPHYRYRMGTFGSIEAKKENGEYKHGTLSDAERESITGQTKGKLIGISREMIVNDDLGAFTGIAALMGRGAARTIESDVFALLVSNPTMGDTGALFNSTAITTGGGHANLAGSGAAIGVDSLEAARVAMASQMDPARNDYLGIRPAVLLCPIGKGGAARVTIGAQYNPDVSSKFQVPNIVNGLVSTIIDTPRLTGTAWYLLADPGIEPVLEVGFLDGVQTPYLEAETNFNTDGIAYKVRLDYGVAAVGWRGAYKNPGA